MSALAVAVCLVWGHRPNPAEQPVEEYDSGCRVRSWKCRRCGGTVDSEFLIGRPGEAPIQIRVEEGRA
jgi:hypothetical protein